MHAPLLPAQVRAHRSDPDQEYFLGISHTDLEPPSSPLGPSYSFWAGQMGRGQPTPEPSSGPTE